MGTAVLDKVNDTLNAIPIAMKVVTTVGFPILMCLYFVARDVGWVNSPIVSMASELHEHVIQDAETTTLLRLICEHTATDQYEKDLCTAAKRQQ